MLISRKNLLQLQHFPKIQKILGPSFNSFCFAFLVLLDDCAKIYFYASHVLLFELILPCYRKCLDFWVESLVICMPAVSKKNGTSCPIQVCVISNAFFFISSCFEIPSEPLSILLTPLRRRFCKVVRELFYHFSIPVVLTRRSFGFQLSSLQLYKALCFR